MFEKDFRDFIELLNRFGARYLVVGGHAVAIHGYPRFTGDMDIWIEKTEQNAEKLVQVITAFGFASLGLKKEDFLRKDYITQIGYPPLRIDILNDLATISFNDAWEHKKVIKNEGLEINFIGLHELINAKEAAGRDKDLMDVKQLKKRK